MSVTRILCDKCGFPLVFCDCLTLRIEPPQAPKSAQIDFTNPAPSCIDNTTASNWRPPKKKKQGRSKFF